MTNPSEPLSVMLIGVPCADPAIDLDAANVAKLLSAYEKSRSGADLKAIPLVPGARPSLFTLKPLNAAALRFVKSATGDVQAQWAVSAACHAFTDEAGVEHKAADHGRMIEGDGKKFHVASDEWTDLLLSLYGNAAIRELAAVIIDRSEAGPRAVAPFRLPRGSMLPR
jgi:hypothetical protein